MNRRFACISLLSLLTLSGTAAGQATRELDELLGQSIVTTPSKGSETDTTAPATSTVISAQELLALGIRTLDEAINYVSLGMSTSSAIHAAEVGARGVLLSGDYGNHVLLMVDGHALNEPWNGTAFFDRGAGVPFEMIDHIEIMLGPGSVLYGSQAMLGVINIVTKHARDFRGVRLIAEADAATPGGNGPDGSSRALGGVSRLGTGYRLALGHGREFQLAGHAAEVTFGLDYYRNRGPVWNLGPQPYGADAVTGNPANFGPRARPGIWGGSIHDADYIEIPASHLRVAVGDFQATVRASAYRRSTTFPDAITAYSLDFDDSSNREIDRMVSLDLSQRFQPSSRLEVLARGYGDLYDYKWYNRTSTTEQCPGGFLDCNRLLKSNARTLGGELRAQLQWPVLRAYTMLGIDAKVRGAEDSFRVAELSGPGAMPTIGSSRNDTLLAPYVAQSLSPTRWLDINLGLRLDHDSRFGQKLSPRSAIGVTPWRGGRIKVIYAEAFRGPSAYELTYHDPSAQLVQTSLGPETVRSIETSFEQRFGRHRLLFGIFRSWWFDMVGTAALTQGEVDVGIASGTLDPTVSVAYQNRNLGRISNLGLNGAYDGSALDGRLRFGLNLTMANSRIDEADGSGENALRVAPRTFGNARITYELPQPFPTLGFAMRYLGPRISNRYYDGGFFPPPVAPELFAMRFALSGPMRLVQGLTYRCGIDYNFAKVEPYVIGANLYANDSTSSAELAPVRRLQGFVGLQYLFGTGSMPEP